MSTKTLLVILSVLFLVAYLPFVAVATIRDALTGR